MDYERGLAVLRANFEQTNRFREFTTFEARLLENLHDERMYGSNENNRVERFRIIDALNLFALSNLNISFNDLASGHLLDKDKNSVCSLALTTQLGIKYPFPHIKPPTQSKAQDLPFNSLSWELFEGLCVALIEVQPVTINCNLYGVQGDAQHGIDIIARQRGKEQDETWVYQCKKRKKCTPSEFKEAIKRLIYPADFYVLMLSIPASASNRRIVDTYENTFLWDSKDIARKLKNYPGIVEDFFGLAWRNAFCT